MVARGQILSPSVARATRMNPIVDMSFAILEGKYLRDVASVNGVEIDYSPLPKMENRLENYMVSRAYTHRDEDELSDAAKGQELEAILSMISRPHAYPTEAFHAIVGGDAVFDILYKDDTKRKVLRIFVSIGDIVILRPHVKHCFMLTAMRYLKMLGLYTIDPQTIVPEFADEEDETRIHPCGCFTCTPMWVFPTLTRWFSFGGRNVQGYQRGGVSF